MFFLGFFVCLFVVFLGFFFISFLSFFGLGFFFLGFFLFLSFFLFLRVFCFVLQLVFIGEPRMHGLFLIKIDIISGHTDRSFPFIFRG